MVLRALAVALFIISKSWQCFPSVMDNRLNEVHISAFKQDTAQKLSSWPYSVVNTFPIPSIPRCILNIFSLSSLMHLVKIITVAITTIMR